MLAAVGFVDGFERKSDDNGAVVAGIESRSGDKVVLGVPHESAAALCVGGIEGVGRLYCIAVGIEFV